MACFSTAFAAFLAADACFVGAVAPSAPVSFVRFLFFFEDDTPAAAAGSLRTGSASGVAIAAERRLACP